MNFPRHSYRRVLAAVVDDEFVVDEDMAPIVGLGFEAIVGRDRRCKNSPEMVAEVRLLAVFQVMRVLGHVDGPESSLRAIQNVRALKKRVELTIALGHDTGSHRQVDVPFRGHDLDVPRFDWGSK